MKKLLLLSTLCLMASQMVMGRTITLKTDDPDLKNSFYLSKNNVVNGLTVNGSLSLSGTELIPGAYTFGWNRPITITEKVTGFAIWAQTPNVLYTSIDPSGNVFAPIPIPTTPTNVVFKVAKASKPCTDGGVSCYLTVTLVP